MILPVFLWQMHIQQTTVTVACNLGSYLQLSITFRLLFHICQQSCSAAHVTRSDKGTYKIVRGQQRRKKLMEQVQILVHTTLKSTMSCQSFLDEPWASLFHNCDNPLSESEARWLNGSLYREGSLTVRVAIQPSFLHENNTPEGASSQDLCCAEYPVILDLAEKSKNWTSFDCIKKQTSWHI